jgi:hypothetical protein
MTGRVSSRLLFLRQLDVGYPSINSRLFCAQPRLGI